MTVTTKDFRQTLKEWNAKITWHEKLHVILFHAPTERIRDLFRDHLIENPDLEKALLEEKNMSLPGIYDNPTLRRICYNLAKSWEIPPHQRDNNDECVIDFWTRVISWLSTYGGEIPDLPGAVRYYFEENDARIDGLPKYPASFPAIV